MALGLTIRIVDPDDDYLGIEICASNERFSGSARIYSGLDELSAFAAVIAGFPLNAGDRESMNLQVGSHPPLGDIAA